MRRAVILLAGLVLAFGAVEAQAVELAPPSVEVWLDGLQVGTATPVLDPEGSGQWFVENYYYSGAEGQITLNAALDPDPSILYAMSVVDFGAPSVFGFVFAMPIVATAAPGIVTHTESSSTTNGSGIDTPVTALPPGGGIPVDGDAVTEMFVFTLSQNGGVTFLNAGLDIRPSFVGAAPSDTQAAINLGPAAGPAGAGFYDFMRVDVNFSMAGGSDAYTFNGKAEVVPEPATGALLLVGLVGLGLARRRAH